MPVSISRENNIQTPGIAVGGGQACLPTCWHNSEMSTRFAAAEFPHPLKSDFCDSAKCGISALPSVSWISPRRRKFRTARKPENRDLGKCGISAQPAVSGNPPKPRNFRTAWKPGNRDLGKCGISAQGAVSGNPPTGRNFRPAWKPENRDLGKCGISAQGAVGVNPPTGRNFRTARSRQSGFGQGAEFPPPELH